MNKITKHIKKSNKKIWFLWIFVICECLLLIGCSGEVKTSELYEVIMHIDYEKSSGFNYKDDAIIYINDKEIGKIENGNSADFIISLPAGSHEAYLKRDAAIRKYKTNKIKFDVSPNEKSVSITAMENTFSGLKISKN